MDRKRVLSLLLAFILGVLLTLLLGPGSNNGRYVPFGNTGNQILDTRNGSLYASSSRSLWVMRVQKVGEE